MDQEQLLTELMSMLPSSTYIVISIVFGIIGIASFRYGRHHDNAKLKWGGLVLMFYPYAIGNDTTLLVIVGLAICGLLYFFRK